MKPKLVLHIGTHKSGSTALQHSFFASRANLAEAGYLYPSQDRARRPELRKHDSTFRAAKSGNETAIHNELDLIAREQAEAGLSHAIISAEGFSEPFESFTLFRDLIGERFDVTILAFFRRPDLFLESFWRHRCRLGLCQINIIDFARRPRHVDRMRYTDVLDFWGQAGEVKAFDYVAAQQKGLLRTTSEALGVDLIEGDDSRYNVSPSANCALLMAHINRLGYRAHMRNLMQAFEDDGSRHAFGGAARRQLLTALQPMLDDLARRYGVAFDMTMPQEPVEPLTQVDVDQLARALAIMSNHKPDKAKPPKKPLWELDRAFALPREDD